MIPRLLSIASPLWAYASIVVIAYGLWLQRHKLEWRSLIPALAGLLASIVLLEPMHRLFFDEDIYINIAGNLAHVPVNQVTVLGGPSNPQVTSYYKEPAGWPVLLSLVFRVTGTSETVAFRVARILFALAAAAVFHLTLEISRSRMQAFIAAVLFAATPICFWFSASAGTDIPAALFATIGMWGMAAGNGALAAGGLAMAAQTRMELLIVVPLVAFASKIPAAWKIRTAGLAAIQIAHIAWVMSVSPVLEQAERVPATFSARYVVSNLQRNVSYLFNPYTFIGALTLVALGLALYSNRRGQQRLFNSDHRAPAIQAAALFCVYVMFYAGSFEQNPRYSIQILAPLAVIAATAMKGARGLLLLTVILPSTRAYEFPAFVQALAADHRLGAEFAAQINPNELVVSAQPEMFINHGRAAMSALYATQHKDKLEEEIRRRKVWYHSGVRTSAADTEDALADRWVKSNFELHLVRSQEINGMRVAFYEMRY
jgi:hypothetical protein